MKEHRSCLVSSLVTPVPVTQSGSILFPTPSPRPHGKPDWTSPCRGTLPSRKGNGRRQLELPAFLEQVRKCRDKGYLLSSRKMGSGAFSKVYLALAMCEHMKYKLKLASDLQGNRHAMVRQAAPSRPPRSHSHPSPAWALPAALLPPSPDSLRPRFRRLTTPSS